MLWLWCRLATAALIQLLAWELLNAMGVALKKQKKTKNKKKQLNTKRINKVEDKLEDILQNSDIIKPEKHLRDPETKVKNIK